MRTASTLTMNYRTPYLVNVYVKQAFRGTIGKIVTLENWSYLTQFSTKLNTVFSFG